MSADLPPKADIVLSAVGTAEKCQKATYAPQQNGGLFDHLVRALLELERHVEAERIGCL